MPTRASDRVTLAVVASPTYVRTYYRMQASNLAVPAAPTTNPPASPWSTTEPAYTAGSTDTLYTVQLIAYGAAAFEYGPVQKSSAYEAAKQAYNLANQANQGQAAVPRPYHGTAVPGATSPSAPNFSVYYRHEGSVEGPMIASYTRWNGAWVETPLRILAGQIIGGEVIGLTFKTAETGARLEAKTDRILFYRGAPAGEPDPGQGIRAIDNGANGTVLDLAGYFQAGLQSMPVAGSTANRAASLDVTESLHVERLYDRATGRPIDVRLTSYQPVLSGPTSTGIGSTGLIRGEYQRLGNICFVRISVKFGDGGLNITPGAIRVSLPFPAAFPNLGQRISGQYYYQPIGTMSATLYVGDDSKPTSGVVIVPVNGTSNAWGDLNMGSAPGGGTPSASGAYGVANNSNLIFEGFYETA